MVTPQLCPRTMCSRSVLLTAAPRCTYEQGSHFNKTLFIKQAVVRVPLTCHRLLLLCAAPAQQVTFPSESSFLFMCKLSTRPGRSTAWSRYVCKALKFGCYLEAGGGGTRGDVYPKGREEGLLFVNFIGNGCQSPQTVMNAPCALGSGPHASE